MTTALPLPGRRVLITGAARGIGAAVAARLHAQGCHVALAGLEPELLEQVAAGCGDAPWRICDVSRNEQVEDAVAALAGELGGLDVVIANAGVAAQLPLDGGDVAIFERTIQINLVGSYYTLRAAAPWIAHPSGYALAIASLAAALQLPLLGAYSASKAGVEALGNTLRIELQPSGARVGVGYFGELDTDMTRRGFGTRAAERVSRRGGPFTRVAPLETGVEAIVRGVERRARRVAAPRWVGPVLPVRMLAQRAVDAAARRDLKAVLGIARDEHAGLTTRQPGE